MLALLLSMWLSMVPQSGVVTYTALLEPAQRTLKALQTQDLSPALRAWVELRLGNVHDWRGERQAAQAWYKDIQGDAIAEALAQAYMTTPFTPAQMDLKALEQAAM